MKIENVKIKSLRDHKIMSYFYVMEFLKILSEPNENNFYKRLVFLRLKLKKRFKLYYGFEKLFIMLVKSMKMKIKQSVEFVLNKNYRVYLINKIKN